MSIIKILGIAAGVAVAGLAGLAITNPGNIAETSDDTQDEKLRTRHYQVDLETFTEETQKLVPTLTSYGQKWKLVSGSNSSGKFSNTETQSDSAAIFIEVPVIFFIDDLKVSAVKESLENAIKVSVRSNSRLGKSDLGENRRHVLQILEALDKKFRS